MHTTANLLNVMPKSVHGPAKNMIHETWTANTKRNAEKAFGRFIKTFQAKYLKPATCLTEDRDVLLTFYDFPHRTLEAHPHHQPH